MNTIIVVDDSPDTNELLCRLVQSVGCRAFAAFTGEGALALIGAERPALVILDVMMPSMDGMEVLRLIRSNPATATLPVILYSAVADEEFKRHAMGKGATDYWVKREIDLQGLVEKLRKYARCDPP